MPRRKIPHPGRLIIDEYLTPGHHTGRQLAQMLGVSASTLSRLMDGKSAISPEMALRLSKVLGRTAESWLILQNDYDLEQARRRITLAGLRRLTRAPSPARSAHGNAKKSRSRTQDR
jgi:addiction module HigA family antidote